MFGLFRKKDSEADFITKADQRMRQSDSVRHSFLITALLLEAMEKKFYSAQVVLIEKYTQWEVDPVMANLRAAALLQLEAKRAER